MTHSIPQEVLDRYNKRYNNRTYRAFKDHLEAMTQVSHGEGFLHTTLNLLIDACQGRCGAEFYQNAEQSLMQLLTPISAELVSLAQAHLANFGTAPDASTPTMIDAARDEIHSARQIAEQAVQTTSEIASWRGRAAHKFASAAAYLLHTAEAILIESHYDSYPLEKLDRAMGHLQDGVIDAHTSGFTISADFVKWLRQLVRAS